MTDNGTFIINGTERVVVSQLHRSPGRLLRSRQGQDATRRASCSTAPASSRTAARGSTSSSTPRTSSTSASTAAASCTRRCCCARSATRPRSCSTTSTTPRPSTSSRARSTRSRSSTSCSPASARRATSSTRRRSEVLVKKNRKFTKRAIKKLQGVERRAPARRGRRSSSARSPPRRHRRGDRRSLLAVQRGADRGEARRAARARHQRVQGPLHRRPERRLVPPRHAARRQAPDARRGDHGDLPAPAPGRSADARDGAERCSTTCSSTPSATTCRRSAASS